MWIPAPYRGTGHAFAGMTGYAKVSMWRGGSSARTEGGGLVQVVHPTRLVGADALNRRLVAGIEYLAHTSISIDNYDLFA